MILLKLNQYLERTDIAYFKYYKPTCKRAARVSMDLVELTTPHTHDPSTTEANKFRLITNCRKAAANHNTPLKTILRMKDEGLATTCLKQRLRKLGKFYPEKEPRRFQ